jgi:hypothetical protein
VQQDPPESGVAESSPLVCAAWTHAAEEIIYDGLSGICGSPHQR